MVAVEEDRTDNLEDCSGVIQSAFELLAHQHNRPLTGIAVVEENIQVRVLGLGRTCSVEEDSRYCVAGHLHSLGLGRPSLGDVEPDDSQSHSLPPLLALGDTEDEFRMITSVMCT